ncbi:MAG: 6,7-dimethyl-8-ribityllumazine synthase [Acidimicrobiia bacterium]|jgi:6,7-dimethyl-8-ribityllumazine synthase
MIRVVEGSKSGAGLHIGVAVASWNQGITDRLLQGALERLQEMEVSEITVLRVPGALELPVAVKTLVDIGCDAAIAIGTVVKGDTDHYDIVVRESTSGIANVALETGVPVGNAILAVHEYQQAVERSSEGAANKGVEAAEAAVLSATAIRELREV